MSLEVNFSSMFQSGTVRNIAINDFTQVFPKAFLKTRTSCTQPNYCHPGEYTDDCLILCATR